MWNAIAIVGLVMMLVGFVAVIKPLRAFRIPTRGRAAVVMVVGFTLLAIGAVNDQAGKTPAPTAAAQSTPSVDAGSRPPVVGATAAPDEPCTVEAPDASARQAAQNWCTGGVFTLVRVSYDADNFIANLQFSNKGLEGWERNRLAVRNQFRLLADEMVTKTDMNVAFSFHDTKGTLVGGCFRKRSERESTCR